MSSSNINQSESKLLQWSAYAAAIWSFLFAAFSFYWALGGQLGTDTLGNAFSDPDVVNDPVFIAFIWVTAVLKVVAGILALALAQRWGRIFSRRLLLIATGGAGLLLAFYGAALILQHTLMVTGNSDIPSSIGTETALRWHLFFWDPYWLLGGILFLVAAWAFWKASR